MLSISFVKLRVSFGFVGSACETDGEVGYEVDGKSGKSISLALSYPIELNSP